jgi:hypothetical protein
MRESETMGCVPGQSRVCDVRFCVGAWHNTRDITYFTPSYRQIRIVCAILHLLHKTAENSN